MPEQLSQSANEINLKRLAFSPLVNPLIDPSAITIKRREVRAVRSEVLVNPSTGEISHVAGIHQIVEKDDAEFVKVFAAGVTATYDLAQAGQRVFRLVLDEYQRTPMTSGYTDNVELFWFQGGLNGRDVGMCAKTFQRGLKELLAKQFLAPRSPGSFWVNPNLFFKGDRVMFIKEYRRRSKAEKEQREIEAAAHARKLELDTMAAL